jgi:hypothetical protein
VSDPLNDPLPTEGTYSRVSVTNSTTDLLMTIAELRRKLRESNRQRGHQSLTLHLTRLERDAALAKVRKATTDSDAQAEYGRVLYYRLRELYEVLNPGMAQGDLDDDYKRAMSEIRRLHVVEIDHNAARPSPVPRSRDI